MRRQIPSITALLCFEAAARSENFGRAAEEVNITQSALSRQIQVLESWLKLTLFTRSHQRVQLTAAGRRFLAELSPQLASLEATVLKIRSHDEPGGAINVGVYPTLGSRWLMPLIVELATLAPELTINTITYLGNDDIDPNVVDIAIAQGDPPWNHYHADYLMPETLVAVASPELLSAVLSDPTQLLDQRVLQHVTRPESWSIWFSSVGLELERKPTGPVFAQFEMLIDAVKRGYGVAILPSVLIARELENQTLMLAHSHQATPESAYYLLVPNLKAGTPRIERFRHWLLERVMQAEA